VNKNTGTNDLVVAGTILGACRILAFDKYGNKVSDKQIGDTSTDLTV
jgi:hypothetical protein